VVALGGGNNVKLNSVKIHQVHILKMVISLEKKREQQWTTLNERYNRIQTAMMLKLTPD
jgi:hypothetical protein